MSKENTDQSYPIEFGYIREFLKLIRVLKMKSSLYVLMMKKFLFLSHHYLEIVMT